MSLPNHLDIHLIRILYMLLTEKSVSRVAVRLNQPQPSISASLRKLRELTGDPLLVRGVRGMVPTQYSESLVHPAKRILEEAERLFTQKCLFQPARGASHFNIAAPDYLDSLCLPNIVSHIRRESPNSTVTIHNLRHDIDFVKMLSEGDVDLVIGNWDRPPEHLHVSKLFEDDIACFMRADCAFALRTAEDQLSVDEYLSLPHVAPSRTRPGQDGLVDLMLARKGLVRNVMVETAYFSLIPNLLIRSDLVLTTGCQFMHVYQKTMPIKAFSFPIQLPPMCFYQLWHDRTHHAPSQKWLRELVRTTVKQLPHPEPLTDTVRHQDTFSERSR